MAAEHAPGRVGGGVGDEGADEDVDQQRRPVVGQVAQQDRVDQRDADPDDPQQRHADRDRDAVAVVAAGAEGEEQREGARRARSRTLKEVPKWAATISAATAT